jgi:pterin-4a-carbinolamine dehydratase
MVSAISKDQIAELIESGWSINGGPERDWTAKKFSFDDFVQAWSFMSVIALKAEQLGKKL